MFLDIKQVKIQRDIKGNEGTCIGIAKLPCKDFNYKNSSDFWLYRGLNGGIYHSGMVQETAFRSFSNGDYVTCVLDVEGRTLSFGKNGGVINCIK